MSEEVLSKLKQADIKLLSTRAKTEMARMLSSWFEANIGKESKDQGDIRCVADRLIAEVIEEDAQGEYVVFANNYIAFLILECEYDTARASGGMGEEGKGPQEPGVAGVAVRFIRRADSEVYFCRGCLL